MNGSGCDILIVSPYPAIAEILAAHSEAVGWSVAMADPRDVAGGVTPLEGCRTVLVDVDAGDEVVARVRQAGVRSLFVSSIWRARDPELELGDEEFYEIPRDWNELRERLERLLA